MVCLNGHFVWDGNFIAGEILYAHPVDQRLLGGIMEQKDTEGASLGVSGDEKINVEGDAGGEVEDSSRPDAEGENCLDKKTNSCEETGNATDGTGTEKGSSSGMINVNPTTDLQETNASKEYRSIDLAGSSSPRTDSEENSPGDADSRSKSSAQSIQSVYHVKWIKWKGLSTPVVTQNENGPCPLLAIINVLLLQRKIQLPSMQEVVTTSQLMEYLWDCILTESPKVGV